MRLCGSGRCALLCQATECCALLLVHKADVHAVDSQSTDALMLAACHGLTDTVDMLLQSGANYVRARPGGATALMDAAARGHEAVISKLLDWGDQPDQNSHGPINVDAIDARGLSALMHAAKHSQEYAMATLLQVSDADPPFRVIYAHQHSLCSPYPPLPIRTVPVPATKARLCSQRTKLAFRTHATPQPRRPAVPAGECGRAYPRRGRADGA